MLHWEDYPIALSPTPRGWDQSGCWSGCAINFHQIPTLIYTGRGEVGEVVCLATSQDDLFTWQKHPRNPAAVPSPPGKVLAGFRDPFVWQNGSGWNMIIGSGYPGKGGAVFLYRSKDLMRWDYIGPLLEWDNLEFGEMWECPNLFHLGNHYLLLLSVMGQDRVVYFIGDLFEDRFLPQHYGTLDAGGYYYAVQGFFDNTGRLIVFGWVKEARSERAQIAAGWAGVQALPRQLSLSTEGILEIEPVKEIEALRTEPYDGGSVLVKQEEEIFLPFSGDCLELNLSAKISEGGFGIRVLCAPDKSEFTEIGYDGGNGALYVDRRNSSSSPETIKDIQAAKVNLTPGDRLTLRIFLDRSIVEVIANKRWCLTSRVYPENRESKNLRLFSRQAETLFEGVKGWQIERV